VVLAAPLKVTVNDGLPLNPELHGLVVPVQVEPVRFAGALQPANVDPPLALAVKVTDAPLSEIEILGEHVLETVCEAAFVPVPPHATGALIVPMLGTSVTEPVPLPAKVSVKLRASVKSQVAAPEVAPKA